MKPRGNSSTVARPVLLVASSGGHLHELLQISDSWPRNERAWVTFRTSDAISLLRGEQVWFASYPTNRNIINLLRNLVLAYRLLWKLRPRAIVTTGAGVAVPFCYLGRLYRARVVYIESYARTKRPSLTGKLVYPIVTSFFVQWPELRSHLPRAQYNGDVFGAVHIGERPAERDE
jgi:beta-1,4-N-acetylglucosaminyltransferase